MDALTCLRIIAAGAIGFIAWHGWFWTMPLSLLAPVLIAVQPNRLVSTLTAFAYYATASLPLIPTAAAFWPGTRWTAIALWFGAAALLSLPWTLCWTANMNVRPWAAGIAIAIGVVPPMCVIGWASPIVASGVLFPGTHWLGLSAAFALPCVLTSRRFRLVGAVAACTAAVALNLAVDVPPDPVGWQTVQTAIPGRGEVSAIDEFQVQERLKSAVRVSTADVVVFPEAAVRRWTDATTAFWANLWTTRQRTVLVGATIYSDDSRQVENAVTANGVVVSVQRIPVPIAMWRPVSSEGSFPLHLWGRGVASIGRDRASILICYEQLLVWPYLLSFAERPSVLLGMANTAWCRGTPIAAVQQTCLRAWGRLFHIPVLSATNE